MEGEHTEEEVSVQVFFKIFLMKIVVFSSDAGWLPFLSIRYDACRRPRRVAPAADWGLKI